MVVEIIILDSMSMVDVEVMKFEVEIHTQKLNAMEMLKLKLSTINKF